MGQLRTLILGGILAVWGTLASAQPTELITTHGRHFVRDGQTFEFVGVNIRGLTHYGKDHPLVYTQESHIDENLNGAQSMGVKVVRLFAANKNYSNADNIARLETVLDKLEARDMFAIVAFTDNYNTDFHPQGDDSYYITQPGGFTLLDDTWYDGGYETNYLSWVEQAVTALKDHNAVFSWQLGNELTDIKTPNNIIAFTEDVAATIKSIDPHHMVSTGFIGIDHTQIGIEAGVTLYENSNIDFMTAHSYDGSMGIQNWTVQARVEKPLLLSEFGWVTGAGRPTQVENQIAYWIDTRQSRGFMNWGYQAQSFDIGDGDNNYGMDQYAHSDYSQLFSIYSNLSAELAASAGPLPELDLPQGTNLALGAVDYDASSEFNASNSGDLAFDGVLSPSSKWTSNGASATSWLAIDLGEEYALTGYVVRMSCAAGEDVRYGFLDYEIQTGPSLTGPWSTRIADANPGQFAVRTLREDTPHNARYVRILVNNAGIDNYARLPEFEVYGLSETSGAVSTWSLY